MRAFEDAKKELEDERRNEKEWEWGAAPRRPPGWWAKKMRRHKEAQRQRTQPSPRQLLIQQSGTYLRPYRGAFREGERGRPSVYPGKPRGAPRSIREML